MFHQELSMKRQVAIDSNAMTYLVDAMTAGCRPSGELAREKIALLRNYLYRDDILYISATVAAEYKRIKEERLRHYHQELADILLGEIVEMDPSEIKSRTAEYSAFHSRHNDCRILAESELGGASVLLTYDRDFMKRLRSRTRLIELLSPSEFWVQLNIPRGARPAKSPSPSNPLAKKLWWVWQ